MADRADASSEHAKVIHAKLANLLEDPLEEATVHDDGIKLEFRGFEIKTVLLKLEIRDQKSSGEWLHV
jgi:hypothetical protein